MSLSNDPGNFFQTDASESTRARKAAKAANQNGNPIKLPSKILNAIPDPFSPDAIYIAESAGSIRKLNIKSGDYKTVYRGPAAPVTSVAIGGRGGNTLFAGCWDKTIWSWNRETVTLGRQYKGHSDFVKVVICARLAGKDILVSGGADAKIIVWDVLSGERIHTLRDKRDTMMALQDLALDPEESTDTELVLLSASSDPQIRRWRITLTGASQIVENTKSLEKPKAGPETILEHETSVYRILFSGEDEDSDLWTASADGTAKCLSRSRNWSTEETYEHGDYVRAIAVTSDWVITGGRNEDVKVWDKSSGKLWHVYEGHYEEVTGFVVLEGEKKVLSVSIDGTFRVWELGRENLEKARKERAEKPSEIVKEVEVKKSVLTAEEEAEIAELMDSDDD